MNRIVVFGIGIVLIAGIIGIGVELNNPSPDSDLRLGTSPAEQDIVQNWLIVGGGGTPEQNQVSIEDDVLLAQQVLPGRGTTLFAGGPASNAVVVSKKQDNETLRARLGELFAPMDRDTTYAKTRVVSSGAALRSKILGTLEQNLVGEKPLIFYFAGHGDMGAQQKDNVISTWGNDVITVTDLAQTLDKSQARPVKLAMTSCFSGGFADVIFTDADPTKGVAPGLRCGVFASPWDMEASGCDPDPDRRNHEGFGVYFLNALRGVDRENHKIDVDRNRDGISLLEAFSQARVSSKSIDVPTTTSERFLRAKVTDRDAPETSVILPEESFVISRLLEREHLESVDQAAEKLAELQLEMADAQVALDTATTEETRAFRVVAAQLLARWPALSDPWHPEFEQTIEQHGTEVQQFLDTSLEYMEFKGATANTNIASNRLSNLQVSVAPLRRIVRASENLQLASSLRVKSREDFEKFQAIRACEAEPLE